MKIFEKIKNKIRFFVARQVYDYQVKMVAKVKAGSQKRIDYWRQKYKGFEGRPLKWRYDDEVK